MMTTLDAVMKMVNPSSVMPDVPILAEQTDLAGLRAKIIEILHLDPSTSSFSSVNATLNLNSKTPGDIALMLMVLIKRLIFPDPPRLDDDKEMTDDVKEMLRTNYAKMVKSHSDHSRMILDYVRSSLPVLTTKDDLISHVGAMLVHLIDVERKQK